jgi:hypothetical protein
MALGTDVAVVSVFAASVAALVSAALTGADNSMAQAVASAVRVASLGDLLDERAERVDWLMAFIKIVTLIYLVVI